jgi:hypothetical protein
MESKKEPYPRPYWDEQRLEYLENLLRQAITTSSLVKMTLWHQDGPLEKDILPIRQSGRYLECRDKKGQAVHILLADILDIKL